MFLSDVVDIQQTQATAKRSNQARFAGAWRPNQQEWFSTGNRQDQRPDLFFHLVEASIEYVFDRGQIQEALSVFLSNLGNNLWIKHVNLPCWSW